MKLRTLSGVMAFNQTVKTQKKINMYIRIDDIIIGMANKGYTTQAQNLRTIIRQHKKGVITFKRNGA